MEKISRKRKKKGDTKQEEQRQDVEKQDNIKLDGANKQNKIKKK